MDGSGRSFIVTRPVAILMVSLAAVVFGFLSFDRLPVTLMPELTYPTVTVRTEYPGSAPEEVENDVSRPVEEALGVIGGLRRVSSISRAGMSDVVLEFAWDTDMSEATQSVLEKLDLVFLPDEAKRPLILHYDPSLDPVMELSLSGKGDRFQGEAGLRRLRRLGELRIKKELEPIKGVAAVRVRGGLEEEIHVLLEEENLRRSGIAIQDVINRLAQENINVAGGTLQEGRIEYLVRTLNEYQDLDQIADTIVTSIEGRDVRIKDLGRVVMANKEREIETRTDGGASVQIEVYKEGDANIVALAKRVKGAVGQFVAELEDEEAEDKGKDEDDETDETTVAAAGGGRGKGDAQAESSGLAGRIYREEGAELTLVADRSLFIESSINEVKKTAVIGGLLAVLVLYVFLRNAKSTAIVAVSIPISLLVTFAPLSLSGISLNIMTLGGLALGIGMLVDSSIVVLESIYRCREEGDDVSAAAQRGTQEVRGAVFASTMTSIAVFFPMVFVEGLAGQAFGDLGMAVVISLLASAGVALLFIPMLSGHSALGLSVTFVTATALILTKFPALFRPVFFVAAILWFFGFVFMLVVAMTGRLNMDEHTRRSMGMWRLFSWQRTFNREAWLSPVTVAKRIVFGPDIERGPVRRLLRMVRVVWAPLALAVVVLGYIPYLPLRFILATGLEVLGKVILFGFLGMMSLVRVVVPIFGWVFAKATWIPLQMTNLILGSAGRGYPGVVRAALAHPMMIILIVLGCSWGTWQFARSLDSELLPEVHQSEFTVEVQLPVGTPIEETERVVSPIEQAILTEKKNISSLVLTLGYDSANSQDSDEGEHTAKFKVLLEDSGDPATTEAAVIARLRDKFEGIPDLDARIKRPVLFSSKTPIEVEIHGQDLDRLKSYSEEAEVLLAGLPELADVKASLRRGAPEVQIVYDRDRLMRYGLNIQQVANLVRNKVKGFEATRFNMVDRRVPIIVRLEMNDRETVTDVSEIIVNPGGERPIPLSAVAAVTLGEGPSEVRRVDGRRVALISANLGDGSLSAATARIDSEMSRRMEWPTDMTYVIAGQNEEWERSRSSLWVALALSIFLVYVIMAIQFESLIHPLVIMLTIPLAFVGTVVTLKAMGMNLSIVVFLGMIMLAGIVVNNAIVLVDYINTLRARGMPRDEAIVTAGGVRLRPILMTTATTVLGLLPMALGLGDGAEIRTPMAIAVISGLISSTALTLIVIPSIYALADTAKQKLLGQSEPAASEALGSAPGPDTGVVAS